MTGFTLVAVLANNLTLPIANGNDPHLVRLHHTRIGRAGIEAIELRDNIDDSVVETVWCSTWH